MRVPQQIRFVDALAEWGAHEARGRLNQSGFNLGQIEDFRAAVDVALISRAPLLWRLLAAWPTETLQVEFDAEDVGALILADGRRAEDWATDAATDQSGAGQYIRRLAESTERVRGPLVCCAQRNPSGQGVVAPVVVVDGWHRVAAWIAHLRAGTSYPIRAHLVVTQNTVPLLSDQSARANA